MIDYRLVRSDRRTLSISVDREGALIVHAPKRMGIQEIEAFIAAKQKWIAAKQKQAKERLLKRPGLAEGESFPCWGQMLKIGYYSGKKTGVYQVVLWLPQSGEAALHAREWRLKQARELITPRVQYWAEKTNLHPAAIAYGNAKGRWGSMNCTTRSLRLNSALLHCPQDIVDYVIVHELVHIIHANHSAAFHAAVRAVLPDADRRRAALKQYGCYLNMWQ